MKRIILLNVLMIAAIVAFAQKTKPATTKPATTTTQQTTTTTKSQPTNDIPEPDEKLVRHFATKYSIAVRWNDLEVAKDALYDLITIYPGSDSLIFALGVAYYENQKYASAALIGQDLLVRTPKNPQVLELLAASFDGLRLSERALPYYESLYLINSSSEVLYKMAFLQYTLNKYPECLINVDILLGKPDVDQLKVTFADDKGKQKEYSMKVPVLNLKALVYKAQNDKVNAKKFFDQVHAIAPDFPELKENMASVAK